MSRLPFSSFLIGFLLLAQCAPLALAQDSELSLGELARRERERKRNNPSTARVLTLEDRVVRCGDQWDCLLAAVDRREEARLAFPENLNLSDTLGTKISSEINVEVREFAEDTAVLRAWTVNSRMEFTEEYKRTMLQEGISKDHLAAAEKEAAEMMNDQDSKTVTCRFKLDQLKMFIAIAKTNLQNDRAWTLAEHCDGLDQAITNPAAARRPAGNQP
jgi:hypothetical protein